MPGNCHQGMTRVGGLGVKGWIWKKILGFARGWAAKRASTIYARPSQPRGFKAHTIYKYKNRKYKYMKRGSTIYDRPFESAISSLVVNNRIRLTLLECWVVIFIQCHNPVCQVPNSGLTIGYSYQQFVSNYRLQTPKSKLFKLELPCRQMSATQARLEEI